MAAHSTSIPTTIPFRTLKWSGALPVVLAVLVLIGAASVFWLATSDAERMIRSFHFNWIFWAGLAIGMTIFSVALHITNARWSWSLRRFALAGVSFLPVAWLLLSVSLFFGSETLFHHWLHAEGDPIIDAKRAWLSLPGMIARDYIGITILFGLAFFFAYHQLRPDVYGAGQTDAQRKWYGRLTGGWRGVQEEAIRSRKINNRVAPVLAMLYAIIWGMIGIDLGMTLLPHWFSTMFPVIFFVDAWHAGLAATIILMTVLRKPLRLENYITTSQYHDIGKLLFAYAVFWMYINWSQYVVIWYGLLPHEQEWFVLRFNEPYGRVTQAAVLMIFVIPFFGLLTRPPKKIPAVLATFAGIILVGHWLERFLITVPSIYPEEHGATGAPGEALHHASLQLGLPEVGIALGFAGLFLACYLWFMKTFPVLPSPVALAAAPQATFQVPLEARPGQAARQ